MIYRCILAKWDEGSGKKKVQEGQGEFEDVEKFNKDNYNCYFLPNYPSVYDNSRPVEGKDIDRFECVFVDMDLKEGKYPSKAAFTTALGRSGLPEPSFIIDSGNGIHVYWAVSDLDAMSFLRLQRRLCRKLQTDVAVCKIYQLMRVPNTYNVKDKDNKKLCEKLMSSGAVYTAEQISNALPAITHEDEQYCQRHYNQTYDLASTDVSIVDKLPHKFNKLMKVSEEVKKIYLGEVDDRSGADYRLGHIMFAEGFTREEAMSVLVHARKAEERSPHHRVNYAAQIVDKIWTENPFVRLSRSVREIAGDTKGTEARRFPCSQLFDATAHGFRLTEVLGLVGGAGSGKTTLALNYFYHFAHANPNYIHLFVSLEQPETEIANRWIKVSGDNDRLHDCVHVLGNYEEDGTYRNLGLHEIRDYILALERETKCKVGCVVIDHIGVLKKKGEDGENQGLIDICHQMKAFAKATNTFLVMQSQTNRQKAGIGDVELDKDAAYGTTMFEWYCDYVVTTWQPLKRVYDQAPDMTCTAFKYCKIRHKNVKKDQIKEDVVYCLKYDIETELLREMTQGEEEAFEDLNKQATTLRNKDRKREPTRITHIDWTDDSKGKVNGPTNNGNKRQPIFKAASGIPRG